MASFCESELGYGHVAVPVVSRDNSAKFEEQYEVHVSDRFFFERLSLRKQQVIDLVPGPPDILKKLTPWETVDIRTQTTGIVSGTS